MSDIRGKTIGTVFQDPMSALTPVYTVGDQIAEAIEVHQRDVGWRPARARAVELLELVGIAQPERRARSFPHELSGGERQRVVIAIANDPDLLICDEPTTALDQGRYDNQRRRRHAQHDGRWFFKVAVSQGVLRVQERRTPGRCSAA